jgi:hypothetical protein
VSLSKDKHLNIVDDVETSAVDAASSFPSCRESADDIEAADLGATVSDSRVARILHPRILEPAASYDNFPANEFQSRRPAPLGLPTSPFHGPSYTAIFHCFAKQ